MRIAWRKRHEWSVGQPGQLAFMLRLIMGRDIIYTWCFPSSARVVAAWRPFSAVRASGPTPFTCQLSAQEPSLRFLRDI